MCLFSKSWMFRGHELSKPYDSCLLAFEKYMVHCLFSHDKDCSLRIHQKLRQYEGCSVFCLKREKHSRRFSNEEVSIYSAFWYCIKLYPHYLWVVNSPQAFIFGKIHFAPPRFRSIDGGCKSTVGITCKRDTHSFSMYFNSYFGRRVQIDENQNFRGSMSRK